MNGNQISSELIKLTGIQVNFCSKISKMKSTWEKIANEGTFDSSLENELNKENTKFIEIEKDVNKSLLPFQNAQEFLSWSLAQFKSTNQTESSMEYPENGYDDIVLEEYLKNGTVVIFNLDKWINSASEVDSDLEKRRILAFKEFCLINNTPFQRIFVITAQAKSIGNDRFVTFRQKVSYTDDIVLKNQFFNIKNQLKPIAPLFESLQSFQFIMSYINDAYIQSTLQHYYQSFNNIDSVETRMQAIALIFE